MSLINGTLLLRNFNKVVVKRLPLRCFQRNVIGKVITPSTKLVKTMLNHEGLFLLLFHAKWCDKCQEFVPDVEELLDEYPGVELCLVDVEDDRLSTEAFGVNLLPTLMGYRDGKQVLYKYGNLDVNLIAEALDKVV